MKQQLEAIRKAALDAISDAGKAEDLEALRVRYLGKKGELTAVLKQMGKLSAEERPVIGQLANDVRAKLEANIEEKTKELADKAMELKLKSEAVDVTIPGKQEKIGVKHPMYQVLDEIKDIFVGMGFEILEDREVELAEYNFTKLNVEEGHPAREWSDTFYFTEDSSILLRTQTSPMQIHAMETRAKELAAKALEMKLKAEAVDVTIPGKAVKIGKKHPMYQVLDEIKDIFVGMGFEILEDREVETADYNFTKLNCLEGHPAREWTDTFYFTEDSSILLRTQTSPMQIHAMETRSLPIRILAPGRVYRKDEVDATHSPMFHQIEGMVIDKGVTMADLKGTLNTLVKKLYGENTVTRFRPHHFPFTEPSCEMDVQCHKCGGKGCPTCKGEGWIEILGAGMIHPKVLEGCGIDTDVYSGWAFGMGLERLAMRRFKISDLRLIFENDVRFLQQF